jgi:hypothetical protein
MVRNFIEGVIAGLLLVVCWYGFKDMASDAWHSHRRYAAQYGVETYQIVEDKHPRDCSFMTSPLGTKGCHYDRVVSPVIVKKTCVAFPYPNTCTSQVSSDGDNWRPAAPGDPDRTVIYISWRKLED